MPLTNNDRIQELALVAGDTVAQTGKKWWIALLITVIAVIPAYYLFKLGFVALLVHNHQFPQIIYSSVAKEPLEILDKKIFSFSNNSYSGYVMIKNINLDWGVAKQEYTVEFKTLGGSTINTIHDSTFLLPSSNKLIVFPRFTTTEKPEQIVVSLGETHFVRKPDIEFTYEKERVTLQNPPSGMIVSAAIKNTTAFTIKSINLPVAVYDNKNQIVAVSSTYIDDVKSGETRTFQYPPWPTGTEGAVRAEITPEVNIFDRNIFEIAPGISPLDNLQE